MSKLSCNVVQDILPLYADDVVCAETKTLVEEHLAECDECKGTLIAMRVKIELPIAPDGAEAMRKVKRRWGKRQLWKGFGIALLMAAVLVGGFFYLYAYGLPVTAEDVTVRAGFQCETRRDLSTGTFVPTGEQVWVMDIGTVGGRVITKSEWVLSQNKDGEVGYYGVRIYVRRSPCVFPWDYNGAVRHGIASSSNNALQMGMDFTLTIVCADQEITYSMTEEGLWRKDAKHTAEFCHMVGEGCPYSGT